jgi:molybdopterin converting factor small subunit
MDTSSPVRMSLQGYRGMRPGPHDPLAGEIQGTLGGVTSSTTSDPAAGSVTVRYWAAARAAAGVATDVLEVSGPLTLAEVRAWAAAAHPGTRLADVLAVCSVLLGDRPVSAEDPGQVLVEPGTYVEFLPPFAGG